jgi:hypothetical protein
MKTKTVRLRTRTVVHGRIREAGEIVTIGESSDAEYDRVLAVNDPDRTKRETEKLKRSVEDRTKPVRLEIVIEGKGRVKVEPEQKEYKPYSVVALTATPEKGWTFSEWSGDRRRKENPIKFELVKNTEIVAIFEKEKMGTRTIGGRRINANP